MNGYLTFLESSSDSQPRAQIGRICFICQQPGRLVFFLQAPKIVCDCCLDKILKKDPRHELLETPERELFCPACGIPAAIVVFMSEEAIGTFDADSCIPNAMDIDLIVGPYTAACTGCAAFLPTMHPTPEEAFNYWRDHPEAVTS
jgi:hypothetical protein